MTLATDTYDCKVPGCANTARHNRGPTAYLCTEHINPRRSVPPREAPSDSYVGRVKRLTKAARTLEALKA